MTVPFHDARVVLVGMEASPGALTLLRYAGSVARTVGARLLVFHAVGPSTGPLDLEADPPHPDRDRARAHELYETFCRESGDLQVDYVASDGRASDAILDAIRTHHADLAVVSTHGRTGIERAAKGSIAETLVRLSPVPVLTLPPSR